MIDSVPRAIRTPDQRLRVFVSSTIAELATERAAVKQAIQNLRLAPVLFEMGARPHPPKDLYRAYLAQSDVFIGIYGQSYGWVAPDMEVSGLEDEYLLSTGKPKLIYIRDPAPERQPRLKELLNRIKDNDTVSYQKFSTPEELANLVANDLALMLTERFVESAPTPDTITHPATQVNLPPVMRGRLIGRERDLALACEMVLSPDISLVTLLGPGGSGKSRLALEIATDIADRFRDGTVFVPLAPIRDPALVPAAVAQALDVQESGTTSIERRVLAALRDRYLLLVLDNFEQVVENAAFVSTILESCPNVKVLATSRRPLAIRAEHELPVPPLAVQAPAGTLSAAVELFLVRAREIRPDFEGDDPETITELCRRLDGLPLAIELAAARVRTLSPRAILQRMARSLDLLTRGRRDLPERQQTLRSAIAWSYDLLPPDRQRLFARLSVFRGGWTLDAAEHICDDGQCDVLEGIEDLIDASLVARDRHDRYTMLETIREFAAERLDAEGDAASVWSRHAEYFRDFAGGHWEGLIGVPRKATLALLTMEIDNIRAAISWSATGGNPEVGATLVGMLDAYWYFTSQTREGLESSERFLALLPAWDSTGPRPLARVWAESTRGLCSLNIGSIGQAVEAGAFSSIGFDEHEMPRHASFAMLWWGLASLHTEFIAGISRIEEAASRFRSHGDHWSEALALIFLGEVLLTGGETMLAQTVAHQSITIARSVGDPWILALALALLSHLLLLQDDAEAGAATIQEAIELYGDGNDERGRLFSLPTLGQAALMLGHNDRAETLFRDGMAGSRVIANLEPLVLSALGLAVLCLRRGDEDRGVRIAAAGARLLNMVVFSWPTMGILAHQNQQLVINSVGQDRWQVAWNALELLTLESLLDVLEQELATRPIATG